MFGIIFRRLWWILIKRHILKKNGKNFWASPFSYVDKFTKFEGYNSIYENTFIKNSDLNIFTYVAINARVINCTIGRFCSIGPSTLIGGLGVHPTKWLSTHPVFFSEAKQAGGTSFVDQKYLDELPRVFIGNDVWIGARAIVLDGLKIGDGAIIAAGAVVTRDVEPYEIVGGVPAKKIKMRYDADTILLLLNIGWWNWPLSKLKIKSHLFRNEGDDVVNNLMELMN